MAFLFKTNDYCDYFSSFISVLEVSDKFDELKFEVLIFANTFKGLVLPNKAFHLVVYTFLPFVSIALSAIFARH